MAHVKLTAAAAGALPTPHCAAEFALGAAEIALGAATDSCANASKREPSLAIWGAPTCRYVVRSP